MNLPHKYRWLWLLAAIALIAVVAFAACKDDKGGGKTPTPAAGERREGGELTVQSYEFASLDPHFSSFAQDISLQRMLWRGLFSLDKENVPQPAMAAAAPEVSDDGKTYTVTLREGLKWSDGDDLLAEDFVLAIHRTCNPVNAGEYQYVLTTIVGCDDHYGADAFDQALEDAIGVKATDDLTIEFTLREPQPTFPIILSLWMTFPVPSHLLPNSSDKWPEGPSAPGKLAYNGPYVLTSYSSQESVELAPNPEWAAPAGVKPTLDKLTIKFIDDLATAADAYRNNELSSTDVDITQLTNLRSEFGDGVEYFKFLGPSTRGLEMQLDKPPLDNEKVRLAFSRAIDREELNRVVVQGGNEPTTSWLPAVTGGADPDAFAGTVGFDKDAAATLLADAGYPNGEGFPVLTILVGDSPAAKLTAEFLQQSFKTNLNIDTEIEIVDSATRSDRFTNEQFELFPGGWIQDYPDPENWILGLFDTGGTLNNYSCSMQEIDDLVDKARFNTNDVERKQQYADINELISTHACGIAPYWHENNHWLIKQNVVGMRENMAGQDGAMPGDWAAEAWGLAP